MRDAITKPDAEPGSYPYNLKLLAHDLAQHHREVGASGRPDRRSTAGWSRGPTLLPSRRVIAVVGAGASVDAGLHAAKEGMDEVKHRLSFTGEDEQRFQTELLRLRTVYRLDEHEFETALLAISSMGYGDRLKGTLQSIYSLRTGTLLQYEILAHLLKHHFLDAIINFNFDELLDRAIADELRHDEYVHVLSDGDCPLFLDDDIAVPVYVKPHGTAGHPSTLRFTREAYFGLPLGIRRLLDDLLCRKPATLLIVGFNMKSFEFNLLLDGSQAGSKVFHFNILEPKADPALPQTISQFPILVGHSKADPRPNLRQAFLDLWGHVNDALGSNPAGASPGYPLTRGVDRHVLVASLFPARRKTGVETAPSPRSHETSITGEDAENNDRKVDLDTLERESKYLHDRCVVELALSIAKAKGLVGMTELASDRSGQYYQRYLNILAVITTAKRASNHGKAIAAPNPQTLHDMCLALLLKDKGYGREALRFEPHSPQPQASDGLGQSSSSDLNGGTVDPSKSFKVVERKLFIAARGDLLKAVKAAIGEPETLKNLDKHKAQFRQALKTLYDSQEIEIRGGRAELSRTIFRLPHVIRTIYELREQTIALLKSRAWKLLLVSAETGQWLLDPAVSELIGRRCLAVVVADSTYKPDLTKIYSSRLIGYGPMNPWEHNQHMTIAISGKLQPVRCIYFGRPRRATDVTPLLLEAGDCSVALQTFAAYWTKVTDLRANGRVLGPGDYDGDALIRRLLRLPSAPSTS